MKKINYHGLLIDVSIDPSFPASRFIVSEKEKEAKYIDILLDKNYISEVLKNQELMKEISKLQTVLSMNYQICNGGISQYFSNGYHEERAPYNSQDTTHFDKSDQEDIIKELLNLAGELKLEKEYSDLNVIANMFCSTEWIEEEEEEEYCWDCEGEGVITSDDEEEEEETCDSCYGAGHTIVTEEAHATHFDNDKYYKINASLEKMVEIKAQILLLQNPLIYNSDTKEIVQDSQKGLQR